MLVVGAVLLALGVDLAALFGWLQGLQIGQYRLPTAPPPDVLADILRSAIEECVDQRGARSRAAPGTAHSPRID